MSNKNCPVSKKEKKNRFHAVQLNDTVMSQIIVFKQHLSFFLDKK